MYNADGQTGLGFVDPATIGTIVGVGSSIWGSLTGDWPKPLPPPLPYDVRDVANMLEQSSTIRTTIQQMILNQGHTHLRIGHQPTRAELERDVRLTADLALWFANGTGDDLSRGEAQIRQALETGMVQWEQRQEQLAIEQAQAQAGPGEEIVQTVTGAVTGGGMGLLLLLGGIGAAFAIGRAAG